MLSRASHGGAPPPPEAFLTISQVAKRLVVSERTVWRWISRGLLEVKRFGRSVRISDIELSRFVASK